MATNSYDGPVITAVDVSRVFGSGATAVTALSSISLTIDQGEFLAVTGRSGSGKTTLWSGPAQHGDCAFQRE